LALVGGAVAGGALVAKQAVGGGGTTTYQGPFRVQAVEVVHQTQGNGIVSLSCVASIAYIGTLTVTLTEREDGTVAGDIVNEWDTTELSRTCPFTSATSEHLRLRSTVTGTTGHIESSLRQTSSVGVGVTTQSFSGALSGGAITGTWAMSYSYRTIPTADGFFSDGTFPETSSPVTLQKQ
jgi:hypothetical protein